MLISFSLKNFKTFEVEARLLLTAAGYEHALAEENTFKVEGLMEPLLRSVAIYGANASGKSCFLKGMVAFKRLVLSHPGGDIPVDPFRLGEAAGNMPSEFEIVFWADQARHRYGFSATRERIVSEWWYRKRTDKVRNKEVELFFRDETCTIYHKELGENVQILIDRQLVREDALLLSTLIGFNDPQARVIEQWFKRFNIIDADDAYRFLPVTRDYATTSEKKARLLGILQALDIGITDFSVPEGVSDIEMRRHLRTYKSVYDADGQSIGQADFSLAQDESSGTQKLFALLGVVLDTLDEGKVLALDELDAKLHPNLVAHLLDLFHTPLSNPRNAQLVFNTHDTNLLSNKRFRRDQIWLVEKNYYGASKLYPLSDYKVRNDAALEKGYLEGRYGGIPFLQALSDHFEKIAPDGPTS